MRGRFIVLEGPDGAGKSTLAAWLSTELGAVATRQPGGTVLGASMRELLLRPDSGMCDRSEALLMAADRAQNVAEVIRPALEAGRDVVCDRHAASSIVYQGIGRGLGAEEVAALSAFAVDGCDPDLVILLDVPVEVTAERLGTDLDRIEAAAGGFRDRVRAGYLELAAADPERWVVVDGAQPPEAVRVAVIKVLDDARRRWDQADIAENGPA